MFAPQVNWNAGLQGFRQGQADQLNKQKTEQAMMLQQEANRRQEMLMQENIRASQSQTYEADILKQALEEEKANSQKWRKANLQVNRDKALDEYIGSLKPDTFVNDKEFGGDISKIQQFSKLLSPDKTPPQIPNPANDNHVKQVKNMLIDEMGNQASTIPDDELTAIAKKLLMSGEYIAVGDSGETIAPVDKVFGVLGAQMNRDAQTKFREFVKMKNQLVLASKGKLAGDGGAEDQNLKLYSQIQSDKKLLDEITASGEKPPQALLDRLAVNEDAYAKGNVSSAAAETLRKNRAEYYQALKDEADGKLYRGAADDVKHFNNLQIKDKEKKFEEVQKRVGNFRRFLSVKSRIGEILGQADISRDAVSNLGFKIKQYMGTDASDLYNRLKGKSWNEIVQDKKSMDAFNRIETAVGYPMTQLIKEISGAAVTNEEREYLMNLVIGGEFKNMDALTEKIDEFVNTLGKEAKRDLNKKVTGGKALRPNWGAMVEQEIDANMSKGIVSSTVPQSQGGGKEMTPTEQEKLAKEVEAQGLVPTPVKLTPEQLDKVKSLPDGTPVKGGYMVWKGKVWPIKK